MREKRISYKTKGIVYKTGVRPAMLHAAKTWGVTKTDARRLEVIEIKC